MASTALRRLTHDDLPPLQTILGEVVFAVGTEQFCWEDVVLAAQFWGDWIELEAEVREAIACVRHAQEIGVRPSLEAASAAASAFRYERDLLTAQETEAWLTARGLTRRAWMDFIQWSALRRQWSGQMAALVARYPARNEEMQPMLRVSGICSGYLPRFARKLAGRVSVHASLSEEAGADVVAGCTAADVMPAAQPAPSQLPIAELLSFPLERYHVMTELLVRLERSFERFRERVLTPRAIREAISAHHLDWIRLDCQSLSFTQESVAREAALCLREDCRDLAEVAAESGITPRSARFFLNQVDDVTLRDRLVGVRSGELVGPLKVADAYVLLKVREKVVPSAQDPEVRQVAEESVLTTAVAHEVHQRVRWHIRL